ncbi:3-ketoacyl-ACP reductase [Rhodococcus sp. SC4]|uniref:mycofactocin-coupled SDR family oxidoreductase n=1 Tax=unclassified Rhodococcus (in: high G+C Gram-positive bacteria) TaxID=192944 RepID=UPI00076A997D|nr:MULTISPECIES: mycofactocin-coupled SDR family oxidoreductase [unclassified Rhodococcus (in: high G+C Gram-positive bacteria)]KXF53880.1 3-ketoacyl-ACP reductase [Rhodococcus sp. SC4]KXX57424.1 3-ketoacyl-ACP reductase [Rhodococcus sp. LB1]PBC57942.1 SDR family mycofactocin-dependent oxidoreductase [Rhodococcus sp. ACPA1]
MAGRLEGKVAFITGGAKGQGRSHAVRLAEEGADIITVDILADVASVPYALGTADDLQETVRQVESLGRKIVATRADVRDYDALKKAVDDGVNQFGRLDIVSANAGVVSGFVPAETLDETTWQDMIDINLTGVWHTVKAATPHLRASGGGSIVITSSVTGLRAVRNAAHYTAAKSGLIGLMKTLALELAEDRIRVNTIHPTTVGTDMTFNDATYRVFLPHMENPTKADFIAATHVLNPYPVDLIEPVDLSNALLFLASEEARYITGVALPIDGGNAIG